MSTQPQTWAKSDGKAKLAQMIKNPESTIHTTMTFDELYNMKDYHLYKKENFKRNVNRLYEQLTGSKKLWPETKSLKKSANKQKSVEKQTKPKKPEPWKSSLAKAFLLKLLMDQSKPIEGMTSREVYESHEVFQQYKFERFRDNLKSLAKAVEVDEEWARIEVKDFLEDAKLEPPKKLTSRGYPFWHKSKAKLSLAADVESGELICAFFLVSVGV